LWKLISACPCCGVCLFRAPSLKWNAVFPFLRPLCSARNGERKADLSQESADDVSLSCLLAFRGNTIAMPPLGPHRRTHLSCFLPEVAISTFRVRLSVPKSDGAILEMGNKHLNPSSRSLSLLSLIYVDFAYTTRPCFR